MRHMLWMAAAVLCVWLAPAAAQDLSYPGCLVSERADANTEARQAWWNRRSDAEKRLMVEMPCEERYIAATCIFLGGGEQTMEWVNTCVIKQVTDKRSFGQCHEQGLEMMTEPFAACQQEFRNSMGPLPFIH